MTTNVLLLKFVEGKYVQAVFKPENIKQNHQLEDCVIGKVDEHFDGTVEKWHQVAGTRRVQINYSCDDHQQHIDQALVLRLSYLYSNIEKDIDNMGASTFCLCDLKFESRGSDIHSPPLHKDNHYTLSLSYQPLVHIPDSKRLVDILLEKA